MNKILYRILHLFCCMCFALTLCFYLPTDDVSAEGSFDSEVAKWLGVDTASESDLHTWSFIISSLKTDGYSENGIAGILGNMRCECGRTPYGLEGYYGACDEGLTTEEFEDGGTYNFSTMPSKYKGLYYNGHGLIQFSGPWAKELIDWSASHDFTVCTITHYCSDLSGYGSSSCSKHTCTLANTVGQMTFLIEELNTKYKDTVAALQSTSISVEEATRRFHDDVERSATSNISERASYGESSIPVIRACTGVVGDAGGTTNTKNETQLMMNELVLGGIWSEEQFVTFNSLVEDSLTLPDRSWLNLNDVGEVVDWKKSVEYTNEDEAYRFPRAVLIFIGILVIIYSVLLYAAYWFDRINNFIEIEMLGILTFKQLRISPDEKVTTFNDDGKSRKIVVHRDMIIVCLIGVGLGVLLVSGRIFALAAEIIKLISNILPH